jgi:hypothetical protein
MMPSAISIVLVVTGMAAIDQDGLAGDLHQYAVAELGPAHIQQMINGLAHIGGTRLTRHENPRAVRRLHCRFIISD